MWSGISKLLERGSQLAHPAAFEPGPQAINKFLCSLASMKCRIYLLILQENIGSVGVTNLSCGLVTKIPSCLKGLKTDWVAIYQTRPYPALD